MRGGPLLSAPGHKLARDLLDVAMPVSLMFTQDIPHNDQQLACDRDNRFLAPNAVRQTLKKIWRGLLNLFPHRDGILGGTHQEVIRDVGSQSLIVKLAQRLYEIL